MAIYNKSLLLITLKTYASHRSAQWIDPHSASETFVLSDPARGNCVLNGENKFTEPESYRVSNYYTIYVENQCGHDCEYEVF